MTNDVFVELKFGRRFADEDRDKATVVDARVAVSRILAMTGGC